MSAEAKAGAFFLVALILLGYFTFQVEDFSQLWEEKYLLKARFDHARELKEGDVVTVSGMRVGKVTNLTLQDGKVLVTMEIEGGVKIYEDAVARITPSGLLGTKYVNIEGGDSQKAHLDSGAEINTQPGLDVSLVLQKIDGAFTELTKMFDTDTKESLGGLVQNLHTLSEDLAAGEGTLGKLIQSPEMYDKLDTIVTDFVEVTGDIRKVVAENEEDIRAIVQNMREAAPELKETFAKVQSFVDELKDGEGLLSRLVADEALAEDFQATMGSLKEFAAKLEDGKGLAQRLVTDEKMADDAAAAFEKFSQVGDEVAEAVADIRAFLEKVNEGEGTIQLLLTERELYDDARRLIDKAEDALRSMKEQIPVGTFTGLLISAF